MPFYSKKIEKEVFGKLADPLSYFEARHLSEPIYQVMITELYEAGCVVAGDYFTCLVMKEEQIFKKNLLKMFVKDNPKLLHSIYDNVKAAEKAAKVAKDGGMSTCLQILHQTVKLLEPLQSTFEWLLKDLYELFVKIAEKNESNDSHCDEMKAHLLFSYALFLSNQGDIRRSIEYFEKSMQLCISGIALANAHPNFPGETTRTLYDAIALRYFREVIEYSRTLKYSDPAFGSELLQKAIETILTGDAVANRGIESEYQILLCKAYILQSSLFVQQKMYFKAMIRSRTSERLIEMIDENQYDLKDHEHLRCEVHVQKAICLQFLERYTEALELFKKSLLLTEKLDLPILKGRVLLHMGQIYCYHVQDGNVKATHAYSQAKLVFEKASHESYKRRAIYSLSQLMIKEMHPHFMKLIMDSKNLASLARLRRWKNLCEPDCNIEYPIKYTGDPFGLEALKESTEDIEKGIIEAYESQAALIQLMKGSENDSVQEYSSFDEECSFEEEEYGFEDDIQFDEAMRNVATCSSHVKFAAKDCE